MNIYTTSTSRLPCFQGITDAGNECFADEENQGVYFYGDATSYEKVLDNQIKEVANSPQQQEPNQGYYVPQQTCYYAPQTMCAPEPTNHLLLQAQLAVAKAMNPSSYFIPAYPALRAGDRV